MEYFEIKTRRFNDYTNVVMKCDIDDLLSEEELLCLKNEVENVLDEINYMLPQEDTNESD